MTTVRSKDGTAIAFERTGEGRPIILVDGAFCSRSFGPMPRLAPALADAFTVLIYDRRGRGESGDVSPYSVAREVEDLAALVEEAGGEAGVYGVSSGGVLALEAARSGVNITKLAVYEPPFVAEAGSPPPPDHAEQLTNLIASGRRGDAVAFFMTKIIGQPEEMVVGMRTMPMWPAFEAIAHTLAYDDAVMGDYTLPRERVKEVATPTLVIGGEESDPRLGHAARALAAELPNAEHRTLAGQTHDVAPDAIAPVLREYFGD